MIPTKHADTVTQALDILDAKNPPPSVADASARIRRVVLTHAGDETTFNPMDFTESDLSEAIKVFEAAGRKDVSGFDGATRAAQDEFRQAMNEAQEQRHRVKARINLVVQLIVAAAKRV
jgi:hypothetical protein